MIYLEIKLVFLAFLAISIVADNKNDILSLLKNLPDKDLKALEDSITDENELNLLSELTHHRTTTAKSTHPSLKLPQGCSKKKEEKGKIIQATASTKLGAELLKSTDYFRSQLGCEKACCATPRCHLAVYEVQDDDDGVHTCYLFNCGTKGDSCSLIDHDKYVSVYMDRSSSHTLIPTTSTTTKTPTKAPTKSDLEGDLQEADLVKEANQKAGGAGLFKPCGATEDCAGDHAACRKGFCLCAKGYAVRSGVCRKKCSALEFECTNLAASLTGPDCVGAEQVCDGSQDCPDASDEEGCEDETINNGDGGDTTEPSVNKESNSNSGEEASTPASNSSSAIEKTMVDTVSEAEGERDSAGKSGAVVALALSLTLTFIMLVYVGCSLRKVKSRIRGRGGHGIKTAEEDYLINGMYL